MSLRAAAVRARGGGQQRQRALLRAGRGGCARAVPRPGRGGGAAVPALRAAVNRRRRGRAGHGERAASRAPGARAHQRVLQRRLRHERLRVCKYIAVDVAVACTTDDDM